MATFELTDASGGVYQVDAPNEQAAFDAFSQMNGGNPAPAPSVGVGQDLLGVAKSAPGRLVAGVAGLPGDLYHLGLRALGDKLTPESNYGSHSIQQALGSDYQAQSIPGKIVQNAVDFAPAAIGGPEGLALKLATRVGVPAVASEVGNEVAGPIGGLVGALGGAAGATAAARRMAAARNAPSAIPAGEKLIESGSNQFNQARAMDINGKPELAKVLAQDMRAAVSDYDPEAIKPVFNAINRVEDLYKPAKPNLYNALNIEPGIPVQMNEIELVRKQLSKLRMSTDPSIRSAAKSAQEAITNKQMALTAADVISGDAPLYSQTMREAVGNYGAGKRSAVVTGKQDLGLLNSGTAGTGGNDDNALRQAFKQLVRPINNTNVPVARKLGFNEPEIAAIRQQAIGTPIGNTARYLGKLAPTGSVSGAMSGGAGFAAGGPLGAVALPAAGYAAKKIGDLSTKRAVFAIDLLVRSRSPLAAQVAAQLPPQVIQQLPAKSQRLLQALILSDPTLSQQLRPALSQQASQPIGQSVAY